MAVAEYIKDAGEVHNDKSLNNREKRSKLEELTIKLNKMVNSETPSLPVLLEALHTIFHPAFGKFLGFVEPANVVEGHATLELIKGYVKEGDIRLNYNLSGGSLMDCGAYTVAAIRQIFQDEPVECVEVCSCSLNLPLRACFGYLIHFKINGRLHHSNQPAWTRGLIKPSRLHGSFPTADMDRSQQVWP